MLKSILKIKPSFAIIAIIMITSCVKTIEKTESYPDLMHIGLIPYDPKVDTLGFKVCDEDSIYPYFHHKGIGYIGEKPELLRVINSKFTSTGKSESGYITIRFIVNCEGKAGRFRTIQIDGNYKQKVFEGNAAMKLNKIIKSIQKWEVMIIKNKVYDYVRYITIKIEDGEIKEIIP